MRSGRRRRQRQRQRQHGRQRKWQRQRRGDVWPLLAAGGSYAPCVGIGVGLAYALAHFICVYLLWSIEREHKASFRCRSKVHYVLDLICSLLLVLSSMSIDPVASYRGVPGADALIMCLGLLLIDLAIWIGRVLEVALTNPYEAPRRQASSQSLVLLQVFGLWATGWVLLLVTRTSDAETHAHKHVDICVVLMWLGVLRWILMTFYRPLRLLCCRDRTQSSSAPSWCRTGPVPPQQRVHVPDAG